jgi:outer membrane biosynthesis protein TonB
MKRWTILTPLPLLLVAVLSFAQQPSPAQPAPGQNERVLGSQLIAWSEMQKPQPVPQQPQPIPAPDRKADQPSPAPDSKPEPKAQQQAEPEAQQSTAQSVSGTIVRVGGKYVLETADNLAYQLDDQDKASQYEGKHVKITGTLDRATGILHVKTVELMS